jgi:uncharacterized protein involved in exopolysaccharide biosynthesis
LANRRQSSIRPRPAIAHEVSKSVELEQRISRLEMRIRDLQGTLELQSKRAVALQAQLDHLTARLFRT